MIEKKRLQLVRIDPEQFTFFFRKYYRRIFSYHFLKTGDADIASDLTQDTFSRALDKLGRFRWQGYSFGAWLFRIARYVEMVHRRARSRRISEVEYEPALHEPVSAIRPDDDLDRIADSEILRRAIGRLSATRQDVVIYRYWLDMEVEQISVLLDVPEPTVKSHLQRGRKQLLKILNDEGWEAGLSHDGRIIIREIRARDDGWSVVDGSEESKGE